MSKNITLATLKKFVKENRNNLYIRVDYRFDGMVDMVTKTNNNGFETVKPCNNISLENTLGIRGCWLVLSSRDYFGHYNDGLFEGIRVDNSCGEFVIAKKIVNS